MGHRETEHEGGLHHGSFKGGLKRLRLGLNVRSSVL